MNIELRERAIFYTIANAKAGLVIDGDSFGCYGHNYWHGLSTAGSIFFFTAAI